MGHDLPSPVARGVDASSSSSWRRASILLPVLLLLPASHSAVLRDVDPSPFFTGCPEDALLPWLSPRHRLPGYHVLCVPPATTASSSSSSSSSWE